MMDRPPENGVTMLIANDEDQLAAALDGADRPVGLVPTMGALHAGHLSLVERARADCATVVVSIFVNPLQFSPGEDFERYPRDLDEDLAVLDKAGTDVVFAPGPTFAPAGPTVTVPDVGRTLEGASRPGHFDGVATIVHKLLVTVRPDRAYFGEKDYQQLLVVRALVQQEGLDTDIVAGPLVRDADGLAISSRNAYLSTAERARALHVSAALHAVAAAWDGDADTARVRLRRRLEDADGVRLDYADIVDPDTLEPLEGEVDGPARAVVAAHVGRIRLIDNLPLERR